MSDGSIIEFNNVTKIYSSEMFSRHVGINDISIRITEGVCYGLVGPNGSGKTTIIKLILGLLYPNKGTIKLFGETPKTSHKTRIGYLPELTYYYDFLTPEEILYFFGRLYGITGKKLKTRVNDVLNTVDLYKYRERKLKTFSKGMLQRLGVAQSIFNNPSLLIVDEPTIGLDPVGLKDFVKMLESFKNNGVTIVFSSHQLMYAQKLCDTVSILNQGALMRTINANDIESLEDLYIATIGGAE